MRRLPQVLALGLLCACAPVAAKQPPRRVIVISLDTLRADHLGLYGYARETAPNLRSLAQSDAVVFERCYAQTSWTLPSHMSIFTGLYPITHGVTRDDRRLAQGIVTLPEVLDDAGLVSAAFTDGAYMARGFGFEDGFGEYHDDPPPAHSDPSGLAWNLPRVERWLEDCRDDDFFLFLHTYDIHAPYEAGEPWYSTFEPAGNASPVDIARLEYLSTLAGLDNYGLEHFGSLDQLVAAYDGMILYADHMLAKLFERLKELELYDSTLIVITSDHGESFMDRDLYAGHGVFLNDAEVHVPLIVKFPAQRFGGSRSSAIVESVDILPTILGVLDVAPLPGQVLQGHDLTPLLEGRLDPSPLAFSSGAKLQSTAVRSSEWTLLGGVPGEQADDLVRARLGAADFDDVRRRAPTATRLVPTGPVQAEDFAAEQPEVLDELQQALHDWQLRLYADLHALGNPEARDALDARELERLRRLGYL